MVNAIALVAALSMTGCSLLFVRAPNDTTSPPTVYADCTESRAWPGIDLGIAGGTGLVALSGLEGGEEKFTVGLIALMAAGVALFSALDGYSNVRRCRNSHSEYAAAHPPAGVVPRNR